MVVLVLGVSVPGRADSHPAWGDVPTGWWLGTHRHSKATHASGTSLAVSAASVSVSPTGLRGLDVPR